MINDLNNGNNFSKAALTIAFFTFLSQVLGFVRGGIFSNHFGRGVIVDSYFAAFRIPDFVFGLLILGTFSVAFIPVFSEYLLKDEEKALKLANSILNVTLILMGVLALLAFVFIDPL